MWIRTSNQETTGTPVYATVTVTDPDDSNGSALIKAARVAIIPIASANAETGSCNVTYASTSYSSDSSDLATVTPLASSTTSIFGLKANGTSAAMDTNKAIDWPTYHDGKVINATGTYTPSGTGTTLGTTSLSAARGLGETSIAPTNVFTIPAATADDYGRVGFVARVWLEGESIYCEDATANQDWNIDFHFSTENTTLPNYTVTSTPGTGTGGLAVRLRAGPQQGAVWRTDLRAVLRPDVRLGTQSRRERRRGTALCTTQGGTLSGQPYG